MKTWVKVLIGTVAGAVVGVGAAIIGQRNNEDEVLVGVEEETEDCDSESNDDEE